MTLPPAPGLPEWCLTYLLVVGIGTVYVLGRAVWILTAALIAGILARCRVGGARGRRVVSGSVGKR